MGREFHPNGGVFGCVWLGFGWLSARTPTGGVRVVSTNKSRRIPTRKYITVLPRGQALDTGDVVISAATIVVWGELVIGRPESPFTHLASINLHGGRDGEDLVVSPGHTLGGKVLAVFGNVSLHGVGRKHSRAKVRGSAGWWFMRGS